MNPMEPTDNEKENGGLGRPKNSTFELMAVRAKTIRSGLMLGKGRREICESENLSRGQYRAGIQWMARNWRNNAEAFTEFICASQSQLEAIQKRVNALLADVAVSEVDKGHVLVKFFRLAFDIRMGTCDLGLKLGILDREILKVSELPAVSVSFGDEHVIPWFARTESDKTQVQ
jgi:hypothetical protein